MSDNNTSCSPSTCSKNRTRTTNNTTFASAQSHISDETSYYSQIDPSRNTSQQNSTYGSALSKTFGCDPCDLNAPAPLANQTVPRPRSPLLGRRSPSPPRRAPANATFASRARTNVTFDTNQCPCDSLDGSSGAEAYNQTFARPPAHGAANRTAGTSFTIQRRNSPNASSGFEPSDGSAEETYDSSGEPSYASHVSGRLNQTCPGAQRVTGRPGRHSLPAGQVLGRSRDYPTDESFEENFNPPHASTWDSFPSMEDSSEMPLLGFGPINRSDEGKYNIILPMSPSPTKAPAPSSSGEAVSARSSTSGQGACPANQTYATNAPAAPVNRTFAAPAVNQTFAAAGECPCPTNQTYGPEGTFTDSTRMSSSGFDSSLPSTNQTYPRAQGRALRPGRHSHAAGQILGRSRDYATEESYEEKFNPKMASTWESFSSMEDSSLVPFLGCAGLRRSQEGIYNIIKPMSPSPTKAPVPSASGEAVSARSSTSVQGVCPANQTYAPPQVPANQTFAGPPVRPSVNQTFAPAGECPCPTNETYGPEGTFDDSTGMSSSGFDSSLPSTNQTYPRAQGRALRPGRHSHAAGQILGRSRDYATEESYEEKFNPRMASTWESFSSMEDSSLVPFLGCAGLRRSQEGIYNIIKPMSPSPTKAPAPTAPSGTFVRGPTNQTYVAPGGGPANQTFTAPGGCPANQTFNAGESEHSSSFERSTRGELPSTGPLASFNRSYPGVRRPDTPRPGTRSLSAGQILCRSRTEPTDESYEENFNPVMASTWESFSSMEDSSLVPFLGGAGLRRSQEGIYNIIKPMSPSPTKAPAPIAPSGTFVRGPTNQTYAAPGGCPANLTFAAPGGRPANQTFSASAESSGMSSFSRSSRGQLPGAGFLESINQTCPGAQRTPVLRPGPHSVPAGQILGRSRSDPSDESYEEKFKPAMASTWQSFSSMEDSSRVPFVGGAGLRRSQEGIYNIIKPMSPSPTKAPAPCLGGEALASHGEGSGSYLPRKGNLPGAGLLESFNRTFPGVQRPASRSRHRSLPDGLGAPAGNQTFGVCPGACTEDSSISGGIPPRGQLPGAGLLESFNQTHPGARRPPLHPPNQTYGGYPDITDSSGYSQSVSGAGRKLPGAGLLESFNQTFPGVQRPAARSGHRSLPGGLGAPAGNQTFGVCPGACTEDSSIGGVPPRGQLPGAGLLESFNQTHPGARRPPLHPPNQTYGGYPDITDSSSYSQSISGAGRKLPGAGKLESFNQTYPGAQRPALKSPRERSLPAGQGAYGPSCAVDSLSGSFRPPHASTWNSFSTLEESSWMPGQGTNPFNSCTGPSGSVNYSRSRHASARNLPGGGMLESFNQTYPGALRPAIQGGVDNCSCPPNLSAGATSFSHSSTGRGGRLPGAGMLESFNQTYPGAQRAPLRSRQEGSLPAGIGAFEPSSAVNSFTGSFRPPHASTWNSFSTLEESSWMPGQGTNPFNSCTGPSGSVNYSRSRHASARNLPGGGMLESFNQTYPGALRPALQGGVDNCSCPPNLSAGATSFSHSSTGRGGGLPGAGMLESFNQTYPGAQRAPLRSRPEGSLPAGIGAFDPSSAVNSFTGSFRPPHASTWNSFSTLDDSSWMPGQGSNPFDTGTSSYNSQYSSMPRGGGSRGGRLEHAGYLDSFNQSYPGALRAPQMQGGNENCTC